jgi:uncharacterized protein YjbI with pentapeptide repeats
MVNSDMQHSLVTMASSGRVSDISLASGHYRDLDLSGVRFESVDARHAVFENCQLSQSSWRACQLEGARFERCNFTDSNMLWCVGTSLQMIQCDLSNNWWQDNSFTQADLASSCLDNIAVSTCDLSSASLPSRLQKAWFSMCQLSYATWNEPAQWHQVHVLESEAKSWSFSNAALTQCSFIRCELDGLQAQALHGPFLTLWKCSVQNAEFSKAMLEGANFEDADLSNTHFNHSTLIRARLVRAKTPGALFIQADLSQADASYLQAHDADFSGSQLDLTNVHGAQLDQARWDDCNRNRLRQTDPALLQAEQWRPATS